MSEAVFIEVMPKAMQKIVSVFPLTQGRSFWVLRVPYFSPRRRYTSPS